MGRKVFLLIGSVLAAQFNVAAEGPNAVLDGLAVYKVGEGEPVFLMPYPHASAAEPMAYSRLAQLFVASGRSVISFDAPGMFSSTREPEITMEEMLGCALEALDHFGIEEPIDVVGHSMGGFCALAFAVEHQDRVKRLVLIGSTSGWPAVNRWGIHTHWPKGAKERRQLMLKGAQIFLGFGNLKIHKELDSLIGYASYVNKTFVNDPDVEPGDAWRRVPKRARWPAYLRRRSIDYKGRLSEINLPVLICVGRYDPQTPVAMNEELHTGIPGSRLVIFEHSGHSPFIEEPERFSRETGEFLSLHQ